MFDLKELVADGNLHRDLFHDLPHQCVLQGLALFDFASRKFPEPAKMNISRPSGNEELPVSSNDRSDDSDQRHAAILTASRVQQSVLVPSLTKV